MIATPPLKKLTNIQSLRGLAAFLVLLAHLGPLEQKHGGDTILPSFLRFGVSGVDLFFVISGFIMVYVTWNTQRSFKNCQKFLFARFSRIYPIYWLIAGAVFLAWQVKPGLMNFDPEKTSFLKSFLLWPDTTLPMLTVAWTLIHELYFYLAFAVILVLPKKALIPALSLWALIVIIGNLANLNDYSPETRLLFHPLTFEFFMGALGAWIFLKTKKMTGKFSLILGCLAFTSAYIYFALALPDGTFPTHWQRVVYFGFPAALITFGLASIERQGWSLPNWSSTFGDWSYSLYLSHIISLSVLGYLWRPFAKTGYLDNIIALLILITGAIATSAALWYLCEKPMLTFFKRLRIKIFK